jgi:hypothetical protein
MELRARLGFGKRADKSGTGSRSGARCELDVRGRGNLGTCMQAETRDEAVMLRLGRSWANVIGNLKLRLFRTFGDTAQFRLKPLNCC